MWLLCALQTHNLCLIRQIQIIGLPFKHVTIAEQNQKGEKIISCLMGEGRETAGQEPWDTQTNVPGEAHGSQNRSKDIR